jgi:TRAP-type transport system small permease protein
VLGAVRAVNKALHYVAGALIVVLMLFTVFNIVGRWLFNSPLRGTVELTELAMITVVYLSFAYAQHRDDHISVDVLYQRFGARGRAVLDTFSALLSLVVLALIAWRLHAYGVVLEAGGRTTAARRIPLYPFAYVAIVGTVAFMLALVSTAIQRAVQARRLEPPGSPDLTEGL